MHLKLDYSGGWSREPELLIILRSRWCHGIPGYKLHDYFPRVYCHFYLHEFIRKFWVKHLPEGSVGQRNEQNSQHRLLAETPLPQHWLTAFLWSKIPWVSFQSIAQKEAVEAKRGLRTGKGAQTEGIVAPGPTKAVRTLIPDLFGTEPWKVMQKPLKDAQVLNIVF